ncbi:cysteine proteinase-like [Schistocerca gregaria]|uniref:cysteine proteinase-like n=1 Tax=Schistocerca gregaria TaxID=7010 RepID=UPI00211DF916|nr:cysteine proteinase-like [Schistocerca gregaria]
MSVISTAILALLICLCLSCNLEFTNAKSFPVWPYNMSYRAEFELLSGPLSIPVDVTIIFTSDKVEYYCSIYNGLNKYYDAYICIRAGTKPRVYNYLPDDEYEWIHIMEKDGLDYWSSTSRVIYNQINNNMIFISRANDNSPVLLQSTSGYPYAMKYFYPIRISYSNFKTDKLTIPPLPNICELESEFRTESESPHISFLLKELSGIVNRASYNEDVIYHHEFSNFISKYSKSYRDKEEYNQRLEIFKQNLQIINEHNKRTDISYSLGITKFSDMSDEEFRMLYTNNEPEDNSEIRNVIKNTEIHKKSSKTFPRYINWVEQGMVGPMRDQAFCGSCWAFSAISALESAWAIKTGNLYSLSEQQLIDCVPMNHSACGGGYRHKAYEWISNHGISLEYSYPYLMVDGFCKYTYDSPVKVKKYVILPKDATYLMDALANHGPLASGVRIYDTNSFKLYTGGIYDSLMYYENKSPLKHSVTIVGYGTDILPDGGNKDYWLIRNSWLHSRFKTILALNLSSILSSEVLHSDSFIETYYIEHIKKVAIIYT